MGTASGAPKIRAMEIIDELEPVRRGPYAGAFGYVSLDGRMDMALTLRTMVVTGGRLHLQAGSGIVADSDPEAEYQESLNKLAALRRAVDMATEGWHDRGGRAAPAAPVVRHDGTPLRVLMVDNYDSFTYNLVQYLGELGAETTVWRNDALRAGRRRRVRSRRHRGVAGPVHARRGGPLGRADRALQRPLPDPRRVPRPPGDREAFGARVVRAPTIMHGKTSVVRHDGSGVFEGSRARSSPRATTR
jgi:hypothetical protein